MSYLCASDNFVHSEGVTDRFLSLLLFYCFDCVIANCSDMLVRDMDVARVREDEATLVAPPWLYSCYYDAGRTDVKTKRSRIERVTENGFLFSTCSIFS